MLTRPAADSVLPAVIVRSCGLPVRALDATASARTMECVRSALAQREIAERLGAKLGEDLYALVPRLDGFAEARRAALRLRRDVHNMRRRDHQDADIALVADHLEDAALHRLDRWCVALHKNSEYMAAAERTADSELRAVWKATTDWLRTPDIALGLALASPTFTVRLMKQDPDSSVAPDSRLMRTATAYLTRTAVKTSPFSSLTTLGVTGWAGEYGPTVIPDQESRSLSSSRSAALELFRTWAEHPDGPSELEVVRNPSLRRIHDRLHGLLPLYMFAHGAFLREDEQTACDIAEHIVSNMPLRTFRLSTLVAREADRRRARRLVAEGLLYPVTPWTLHDGRHFRAFHRCLRDGLDGGLLAETIARLDELEDRIAQTRNPGERAVAAERTRTVLTRGFRALGRDAPRWMSTTPLFYEVVAHGRDRNPVLPDVVRADLRGIGARQARRTRISGLYERLVDYFVQRHGEGGTAPDLLGFLYEFMTHIQVANAESLRLEFLRPVDTASRPRTPRGHRTVGHPTSAVFFQLAAENPEAVARGDYALVVNTISSGFVGLMTRWACVPALHDRLAGAIGGWLAEQHEGCRVYQLSAQGDWVTFQRPALRSIPRVAWGPGLAGGEPGVADLRGFSLHHDPDTHTLQVRDASGPAAFTYVGSIPPQLLRGVDQLLCLLSDPWVTGVSLPDDPADLPPRDHTPPPGDVTHYPRVQRGRVVWRRARWRSNPSTLPDCGPGTSTAEFLARAERWRLEHAIPGEVFVNQATSHAIGTIAQKPQWVDFQHASVVGSAFRQIDPAARSVEFVEALPARHQHWWRDGSGEAIATEFIALVRHTRED
ncbi:lantibiotic dehydratase [Nocardia terpenica]|uniref:lantibiotic dehydratase n=1 Tax=Nocardia terpenica TaxID=455432 RepID=UPI0012FD81D3|nr:lantibiotic dehydratase [Nocardia terpenica]